MKPSEDYFKKMFKWDNSEEQRKLILDEKCKYDFRKTSSLQTRF